MPIIFHENSREFHVCNDQISYIIKILKNKYPHTFAIILNGGGYAESNTEYSGAFLLPDLRYKLSDLIQDKYKCVSYYDHTIID